VRASRVPVDFCYRKTNENQKKHDGHREWKTTISHSKTNVSGHFCFGFVIEHVLVISFFRFYVSQPFCTWNMPSTRRSISEKKRRQVFDECKGRCWHSHCGSKLTFNNRTKGLPGAWHIDHLIPVADGGSNDLKNLVAACIVCNQEKSDKSVREFNDDRGDKPKCQGLTKKKERCKLSVGEGNKKFCHHHSKKS